MTIELQGSVSGVAHGVGPKVVGISGRRTAGSGVVIAPGRVLTNAHNLSGDELRISFDDEREVSAAGAASVDADHDLAVFEVDTGSAEAVEWASQTPGIGAPVFALSNPGGRGLRVTFGLVSGIDRAFRGPRGRVIEGAIEHTAPLLPGSSGGPIVDASGRLLGINTHRLGEGFYLAIPADAAVRARVDALAQGRAPKGKRLGIAVAPNETARRLRRAVGLPEIDGVLVRAVEEDSAAARAGLQEGDLITKAGGRVVNSPDDLFGALDAASDSIELEIVHGTEERRTQARFD
jgi:serine protease Do